MDAPAPSQPNTQNSSHHQGAEDVMDLEIRWVHTVSKGKMTDERKCMIRVLHKMDYKPLHIFFAFQKLFSGKMDFSKEMIFNEIDRITSHPSEPINNVHEFHLIGSSPEGKTFRHTFSQKFAEITRQPVEPYSPGFCGKAKELLANHMYYHIKAQLPATNMNINGQIPVSASAPPLIKPSVGPSSYPTPPPSGISAPPQTQVPVDLGHSHMGQASISTPSSPIDTRKCEAPPTPTIPNTPLTQQTVNDLQNQEEAMGLGSEGNPIEIDLDSDHEDQDVKPNISDLQKNPETCPCGSDPKAHQFLQYGIDGYNFTDLHPALICSDLGTELELGHIVWRFSEDNLRELLIECLKDVASKPKIWVLANELFRRRHDIHIANKEGAGENLI